MRRCTGALDTQQRPARTAHRWAAVAVNDQDYVNVQSRDRVRRESLAELGSARDVVLAFGVAAG